LLWAKSCGVSTVITYTDLDNVFSSNNLIASGFKLYKPDLPWGNSDDALYWTRKV